MFDFLKALRVSLIQAMACIGLAGSASLLWWYARLSRDEKANADAIAEGYAKSIYDKNCRHLSSSEAAHIDGLTKRHFNNRKDW